MTTDKSKFKNSVNGSKSKFRSSIVVSTGLRRVQALIKGFKLYFKIITVLLIISFSSIIVIASNPIKLALASSTPITFSISKTFPTAVGGLYGVSCASTSDCIAVGYVENVSNRGGVVSTTDGGTTWITDTVPLGIYNLYGVSCASTSDCIAVGMSVSNTGVVISTTDGGTTWITDTVPAGI